MQLHKPVVRARETQYREGKKPGRRVGPVSGSSREALALRGFAASLLAARARAGLHMTEPWM